MAGHWELLPSTVNGFAVELLAPMCDGERCRRVARWVLVDGTTSEVWACDEHHAREIQ